MPNWLIIPKILFHDQEYQFQYILFVKGQIMILKVYKCKKYSLKKKSTILDLFQTLYLKQIKLLRKKIIDKLKQYFFPSELIIFGWVRF